MKGDFWLLYNGERGPGVLPPETFILLLFSNPCSQELHGCVKAEQMTLVIVALRFPNFPTYYSKNVN